MLRQTAMAILMLASCGWAQPTGHIQGTVTCANGDPAVGAVVRLDCYLLTFHASATTGVDGTFEWSDLENGAYYVTAMCLQHGFAFDSRAVEQDDTASVALTLSVPIGDELTQIYAHGVTIVEPPDEDHALPWYFVDLDGDQTGDYRLCFGPPWYDPPYVDRPANGSEVAVTGGLFSYAAQPMLIVNYLGGHAVARRHRRSWRVRRNAGLLQSRRAIRGFRHVGHGGTCEPPRIELKGIAHVHTLRAGYHGTSTESSILQARGQMSLLLTTT